MRGIIFSGSGSCSSWWTEALCDELTAILGYRPVPGSLNVVLLGPRLFARQSALTFWDRRRPRQGRAGGTYHFWRARFGSGDHAINAHAMIPDVRGHGPNCIELVAAIRLREAWELIDGSRVWIRPRR
jgi:CTP-dependent riboflavin kinase